jgi:signal transduction histidine kinase
LAMAIAGHDLRQRLHSLLGTIELLKLSEDSDRTAKLNRRAKSLIHRLADELGRLAFGTRHDPATSCPPAACRFSIASLSEQLRTDWEDEAIAKQLRFSIDSGDYPVESDPRLLASIMDNLVGNAVKHTNHGGIIVALTNEGRHVIWSVTDTGPGISEHALRSSLGVAPRSDASNAGMGLGLSIARKTADLLGHPLVIDTAPNRGTSIRIELPLAIEYASN